MQNRIGFDFPYIENLRIAGTRQSLESCPSTPLLANSATQTFHRLTRRSDRLGSESVPTSAGASPTVSDVNTATGSCGILEKASPMKFTWYDRLGPGEMYLDEDTEIAVEPGGPNEQHRVTP